MIYDSDIIHRLVFFFNLILKNVFWENILFKVFLFYELAFNTKFAPKNSKYDCDFVNERKLKTEAFFMAG